MLITYLFLAIDAINLSLFVSIHSSPAIHSFYCFVLSGVIVDSNTMCFNATIPPSAGTNGAVGTKCTSASNCLYNICTEQKCGAPLLQCPSAEIGKTATIDILFKNTMASFRSILSIFSLFMKTFPCVVLKKIYFRCNLFWKWSL